MQNNAAADFLRETRMTPTDPAKDPIMNDALPLSEADNGTIARHRPSPAARATGEGGMVATSDPEIGFGQSCPGDSCVRERGTVPT